MLGLHSVLKRFVSYSLASKNGKAVQLLMVCGQLQKCFQKRLAESGITNQQAYRPGHLGKPVFVYVFSLPKYKRLNNLHAN